MGVDPAATELRESVMALARQMRAHRSEDGLTLSQRQILGEISRAGTIHPAEIGARMRVRAQSLTEGINVLVQRGLVIRRSDLSDKRRQVLRLTEAGAELLAQDRAERDAWLNATMREHLSDLEISLLMLVAPVLRKLADAEPAQSQAC